MRGHLDDVDAAILGSRQSGSGQSARVSDKDIPKCERTGCGAQLRAGRRYNVSNVLTKFEVGRPADLIMLNYRSMLPQ
jgi:hypothetical protein